MPAGPTLPLYAIRWLPAFNQNAAMAPAYALVRITGCDFKGNYNVDQPNTDSQDVFVVGPAPMAPVSYSANGGSGQITRDFPWWAAYEPADGTPAIGDTWGAGNGSWKLRKGKTGFLVVGVDTNRQVAMIVPPEGGGPGLSRSVKINNGTPNGDGTYDAVVEIINSDLSLTPDTSVWFFDPNKPGALLQGHIYTAYYAFVYMGRPLYVRDDFDLTVKDLQSLTTFNFVQEIDFDSTPTPYDPSKGDFVFTYTASTRTLKVRLNGFTGAYPVVIGASFDSVACVLSTTMKTVMCDNGLTKIVS